jgi:hypothetical protein
MHAAGEAAMSIVTVMATILLAAPAPAAAPGARQAASASPRVVRPVDEGSRDPSFAAFRDRLLRAVRARDVELVLGAIDPAFGTEISQEIAGAAAFERTWKLRDNPRGSPVWKVLEDVLTLGGTFMRPDMFCAPYVYTKFPDEVTAADHAVVLRSGAPVFARPAATAPIVASASFEIVRTQPLPPPDRFQSPGWVVVDLASGRRGYMREADVRSPIDYRACFVKRGGAWKMAVLSAGD